MNIKLRNSLFTFGLIINLVLSCVAIVLSLNSRNISKIPSQRKTHFHESANKEHNDLEPVLPTAVPVPTVNQIDDNIPKRHSPAIPEPIDDTEILIEGEVFQVLENGFVLNNCKLFFPTKLGANSSGIFGRPISGSTGVVEVGKRFQDPWYGGKVNVNIFVYLKDTKNVFSGQVIGPVRAHRAGSFEYVNVLGAKVKIRSFSLVKDLIY